MRVRMRTLSHTLRACLHLLPLLHVVLHCVTSIIPNVWCSSCYCLGGFACARTRVAVLLVDVLYPILGMYVHQWLHYLVV